MFNPPQIVWVAPLRVAMRSPLPFPCVPDRPSKILLVQVGTLSSPIPRLVCLFSFFTLPKWVIWRERECV